MFGLDKGNTAIPLQTSAMTAAAPLAAQSNPMGSGALGGMFPAAPQLGIFDRLQNGFASIGQPLTPEELQRQQMLQQLQQQQQPAQFSPVQFGGASNNGGPLSKYINMLKGGM